MIEEKNEKKKPLFRRKPLEFWGFVVTFAMSLVALLGQWTSYKVSQSEVQIREIIRQESEFARDRNSVNAVSLFVSGKDTAIYDAGPGGSNWIGSDSINRRYATLPQFKRLVHFQIKIYPVDFGGRFAQAETVTEGEGTQDGQSLRIIGHDFWELEKVNHIPFLPWTGQWKIKTLTVNMR